MVSDRGIAVRPHRHPNGANCTRPERANEYGTVDTQVRRDGHEDTIRTGDQDERETDTEDRKRQCTLLARGMLEDSKKERRPPEWQCAPTPRNQAPEGDPQTRQRALLACGKETEEEGGPTTQQRAQPARGQGREGATPNTQITTTNMQRETLVRT